MKRKQRLLVISVVLFIFMYLIVLLWRGVRESAFFQKTDRINLLAFGVEPVIISLGLSDGVNYIARFDNSLKTYVPGGYGYYGIGSLSKLGTLERDTDLLRRTFSLMISADVDFYLYPKQGKIYHDTDFTVGFSPTKSAIISSLISRDIATNARFLDKLYLFLVLIKQRKIDYVSLKTGFVDKKDKESIFASDEFFKSYQGFFYKKNLRNLDTTIQIKYYDSILSARHIARILDGQGVRVSDIDVTDTESKKCLIRFKNQESKEKHFITEVAIRKVLKTDCISEVGDVGSRVYSDSFDIVVVLDPKTENLWR